MGQSLLRKLTLNPTPPHVMLCISLSLYVYECYAICIHTLYVYTYTSIYIYIYICIHTFISIHAICYTLHHSKASPPHPRPPGSGVFRRAPGPAPVASKRRGRHRRHARLAQNLGISRGARFGPAMCIYIPAHPKYRLCR